MARETPTSQGDLPADVEAQVHELTAVLRGEPRVAAVVLLGSAARGELVTAMVDGRREVFGDLELLAVTDGRLPAARRRDLARTVAALAADFGYRSPAFHADVLFRERRRLASLPPIVFTHELGANGRVVWGADVLPEVRRVTAATLDRRNTHEILMKRLWALAEAVPAAVPRGGVLDEVQRRAYRVAVARNALDVPTVLLPEVGVLLATYAERVRYWTEHPGLAFRAALDAALGGDSGAYLAACVEERANAGAPAPETVTHEKTCLLLRAALAWLLGCTPEAAADEVARCGSALMHERPISAGEVLGLARVVADLRRTAGLAPALAWLRAPRKSLLAAGLLRLHESLAALEQGKAEDARAALAACAAVAAPAVGPWVEEVRASAAPGDDWLAARRFLGIGFWRTVRLGEPDAGRRLMDALVS